MPMNLSLGIGIGHNGGPIFDPDARAWFAAMPTQLNAQAKQIGDNFICGLKADDLWGLIDGGNFPCLETLAQGLVDFRNPARVATTAPGFTSTFTAYRWVTGSGSASGSQDAYIEIPFNPSTAGGNWSLNSVHTLVACGNDVAGSTVELGTNTGGDDYYHVVRNASSQFQIRSNSSATSGIAGMASSVGITIASRTGANAIAVYSNGSLHGNVTTQPSVSVPNGNLRVLQLQGSLATTKSVQAIIFGAGLDATQAANLTARVQTAIAAWAVL
jgi:hypothetical protein